MIYNFNKESSNGAIILTLGFGYFIFQIYLLYRFETLIPYLICIALYLFAITASVDSFKLSRTINADLKEKRFCHKELVIDTITPATKYDRGARIQFFHYALKDTDGLELLFASPLDFTTFKESEYAGVHITVTYLQESRLIAHIEDCATLENPEYKVPTGRVYKALQGYMTEENIAEA